MRDMRARGLPFQHGLPPLEAVFVSAVVEKEFPMQSRTIPHRLRCAAALALVGAASLPAFAQTEGNGLRAQPYVGLSIGSPDWRTDNFNGVTGGDSHGTGWKLYGGYAFNPNFALEAGGVKLGRLSGNGQSAKADGLYVDAVGMWPVARDWTLLGRLGVVRTNVSGPLGSEHGTSAKGGLGVQYNLSRNVSLRGEWERYGVKAFGEKPSVDLYSVGVNYAF
jgi:OOP family OmpA-OmpF porin